MEKESTEPPTKKMKSGNLSETIDKYIEKLKQCVNLYAILADDLEEPLPLIKVTVGHVKNPKEISKTIKILYEYIPLKELGHLKRARGRDILLCPSSDLEGLPSIQEFIAINAPELKDVFEYFKVIEVPSIPAKIKKQYSGHQAWSLNFHPNQYLEALVSGNFFPKDQMKLNISFMNIAFEVARWYLKNETSVKLLNEVNATIVTDPSQCSVVAIAFCNKDHPIQHSTMLAIDNVAKTQNGGAWGANMSQSINCTLSGIEPDLLKHLTEEFSNISFGSRVFKSKKAASTSNESPDVENTTDSPYLCTGYHIYMLREPCIMCSMALVHARAKRIFFCFDNNKNGGVKSKVKLQTIASLNHHFEVFTGFL